ncbi:hypothetical protein AMJ82_12250 [candidate division TA06 bacterium SM23_40]|uniref:Uncharacterized protein n=1 Tax=candidate division TA06 bacterium SM23_40 TaxID=1703774 RepID=A0A0S8FY59_UNCT6|nr:MAG: hypothetical protein AMJ82_12250 [candidate division TA06 bacterium SM23_40]
MNSPPLHSRRRNDTDGNHVIQRNSTGEKRGGEQDRVELTILSLKGGILYDINLPGTEPGHPSLSFKDEG